MPNRHDNQRGSRAGVSLIETIVVVGVMSIIMVTMAQIFILNYSIYSSQTKRAGNDLGAVLAAQAISQLTRGASNVEVAHDFGGTVRTSSSSVLVLKMPSLDSGGNVLPGFFDYVAVYRGATEPTKIFIDTDADAISFRQDGTRMITDYNTVLIFRYDAPDLTSANRVSAYLVNAQTDRNTTLTTRAWLSIFLRNKI